MNVSQIDGPSSTRATPGDAPNIRPSKGKTSIAPNDGTPVAAVRAANALGAVARQIGGFVPSRATAVNALSAVAGHIGGLVPSRDAAINALRAAPGQIGRFIPSQRWFWTRVDPGMEHRRAWGWTALFLAHTVNLWKSESFDAFLEDKFLKDAHKRPNPTAPLTGFLAGRVPMVVIVDDRDATALNPHMDKMTQGEHAGMKPLGLLTELFGQDTILALDKFAPDPTTGENKRNTEYFRQLGLVKNFVANKKLLNAFAESQMPGLIHRELEATAASPNGRDLGEVVGNLAVNNGMGLILGVEPRDYYTQHRRFFDEVVPKTADPKLLFSPWQAKRVISDATQYAVNMSLEIIEQNYEKLLATPNLIVAAWESAFDESFPRSYREFTEIGSAAKGERAQQIQNYLRSIVFIAIASSETTDKTLQFAFQFLLKNPEWVTRLQEEVDGKDVEKMSLSTMKDFPVLSAFVAETLDLYGPVTIAPYVTTDSVDVVLHGQPVHIPEGTLVVKHLAHANRSSLQNPQTFDPDRYLPSGEGTNAASKFNFYERPFMNVLDDLGKKDVPNDLDKNQQQFFSFSFPGRICPGRWFSVIEITKALAMTLQRFDIQAMDEHGNVLPPESVSLDQWVPATRRLKVPTRLGLTSRS